MLIEITSKLEWRELIEEVYISNNNEITSEEFKEIMHKLLSIDLSISQSNFFLNNILIIIFN